MIRSVRTHRRWISTGALALLVVVVSIAVGMHRPASNVTATTTPAASPSPAELPVAFRDTVNGNGLSIQLQTGRPDTGQFTFTIPTVGSYRGQAGLAALPLGISTLTSGALQLRFAPNVATPESPATGSLVGAFGIGRGSADVTLITTSGLPAAYRIHAHAGDPAQAAAVSRQFDAAMVRKDYVGMYGMLAPEDTQQVTQASFVQTMSAPGSPTVTAVDFNGGGQMTSAAGWWYYTQPVTVSELSGGTTRALHTTMKLVLYGDRWFVLSTGTPS